MGESFLLSSLITSFSTLSMGALVLAVIVHLTALLLFLNIDKLEKGGCSQSKDAKAQIWNRHMEFLEPKQPTDETGLCPACGRTISSVDNFCLRCGHNLHADQALAPTAPPWVAPGTVPQPLHATPEWVPPAPLAAAPAVPASLTERRARIILRSVNGEVLGEYDLKKPETSVGRGSDNDIVVPKDKLVSRHQAAIRFEEGYYLLCDLKSANGSYVNAKRVSSTIPFILEDGDSIRMGSHELIFRIVEHPLSDFDEAATVLATEEENEKELEEAQFTERSSAIPSLERCFTAFHPKAVVVDGWNTLLVYAYVEAAIRTIQRDAEKFDFDVDEPAHNTSSLTEQHSLLNRRITVIPECQGVLFNPKRFTFQWSGDWQRSAFRFWAKKELAGSQGRGKVTIFVGPLLIATLDLALQFETSEDAIGAAAMANAHTKIFKRIFPSYSRRDAPFIEAYQDLYSAREFEFIAKVIKAREGRNFNQDIQQMIADAEIFQLFWSSQAHHSGYVLSELKYALQCKRSEDFIRPIYWEVPLVSVPEQLASYHFTYLPKYAFS